MGETASGEVTAVGAARAELRRLAEWGVVASPAPSDAELLGTPAGRQASALGHLVIGPQLLVLGVDVAHLREAKR